VGVSNCGGAVRGGRYDEHRRDLVELSPSPFHQLAVVSFHRDLSSSTKAVLM
jgi:hypothetical protein